MSSGPAELMLGLARERGTAFVQVQLFAAIGLTIERGKSSAGTYCAMGVTDYDMARSAA